MHLYDYLTLEHHALDGAYNLATLRVPYHPLLNLLALLKFKYLPASLGTINYSKTPLIALINHACPISLAQPIHRPLSLIPASLCNPISPQITHFESFRMPDVSLEPLIAPLSALIEV